MNIKNLLFFGIIVIFFSCSRPLKPVGITVSGHFQNASGKKIYFSELEVDGIKNLDSTVLDDKGVFQFYHKPVDAGFYLIKSSSGENILLLMEKEESANVSADFKKAPFNYEVTGSSGSTCLKNFYSQTFINLSKADSLASILRKLKDTPDLYPKSVAFEPLFQNIIEDQKNLEKLFIRNNIKSLSSLIALNYKFGILPVLQEDEDFDLYLKLDSTLSKIYPSNKHVLFLHQRVAEHQRQQEVQKLNEAEKRNED